MTELLKTETLRYALSRAKYVARDFYTFADDLVARVTEQFPDTYNDFVASDTGTMLIEIVAWAADSLAFVQDRYAAESFLETARIRRAVNRLARPLGYKMGAATAASDELSINLAEVQSFDVTIPIGFQFKGPNELIFEAAEAVIFPAGEGPTSLPRTVSIREGETVSHNFRSDGTKKQNFVLSPGDGRFVAKETAEVTVAGSSWSEQEFLPYEQEDYFEIDYNADPPLLRFGDGRAGNIPASGADIYTEYLSISGKAGNVPAGTITSVVDDLVVAFTTIDLIITHPDRTSGGDDRESLDQARTTIPNWFASRDVAVTAGDYHGLARAFRDPVSGSVAVAHAFVALGADDDITLENLILLIRSLVSSLASTVQASTSSISTSIADLNYFLTAVDSDLTDIGTDLSTIDAQVTAANLWLSGIGVAPVVSTITDADRAALSAIITALDTARQAAESERVTALASNSAAQLSATDIATDVAAIDAAVSSGFETSISGYLDDIYDHVDAILSSTCKANLVTVPILTLDSDGFYAAPSVQLVRSLQAHLDARKEVSQSVVVVSGENSLVSAVITGTIGVASGYVQAKVVGQCYEAIYGVLRGRAYNADLHVTDLTREIVPKDGVGGIPGVAWAVVRIIGPSGYIDADGTLVVDDTEVITRGSVTLVPEAA